MFVAFPTSKEIQAVKLHLGSNRSANPKFLPIIYTKATGGAKPESVWAPTAGGIAAPGGFSAAPDD